jgi:hypothetical protein
LWLPRFHISSATDPATSAISTGRASDVRFTAAMHLEGVATIPRCAECEADWLPADTEPWQAWLTDDEPAELVFYCLDCAEREFGGD